MRFEVIGTGDCGPLIPEGAGVSKGGALATGADGITGATAWLSGVGSMLDAVPSCRLTLMVGFSLQFPSVYTLIISLLEKKR